MSRPKFLAVKNFSRFQHYKDRRPLWIKYYGSILDDYAFVQLPDAAKAHLMLLWQVAATHGNRIPYDQRYIQQATKARSKVNIEALIASGFLIDADSPANAEESASNLLASGYQDASLEKNREEKRREETTSVGPSFESSRLELIALLGGGVQAVQECETFFAGLPSDTKRLSWARNLVLSIVDGHGHPITPPAMLAALADFNLSDRGHYPYNGAVFRGFVDRASKPKLSRTDAPRGSTVSQRTLQNGIDALKDIP